MDSSAENVALSFDKLPKDLRVEIGLELTQVWDKIKEKVDYGQLERIKLELGKEIYNNSQNFTFYISGK